MIILQFPNEAESERKKKRYDEFADGVMIYEICQKLRSKINHD